MNRINKPFDLEMRDKIADRILKTVTSTNWNKLTGIITMEFRGSTTLNHWEVKMYAAHKLRTL